MEMPARKRIKNACFNCHSRKVRCDLATRGPPCTNCQDDGTAHLCKLHVRKSRRASSMATGSSDQLSGSRTAHGSSAAPKHSTLSPFSPGGHRRPPVYDPQSVQSSQDALSPTGHSTSFTDASMLTHDMLNSHLPLLEADFSDFAGLDSIFNVDSNLTMEGQGMWAFDSGSSAQLSINVGPPATSWTAASGSPQIQHRPIPEDQDHVDENFLESQGCFTLPESKALCRLMMSYFRYVHPNLPVINEADFWRLWPPMSEDNFSIGSFSILVLQAMCFTAASVCHQTRHA